MTILGGLASLLRCREGDVVGGAATAAVWALCRSPENRKAFAKIRWVAGGREGREEGGRRTLTTGFCVVCRSLSLDFVLVWK